MTYVVQLIPLKFSGEMLFHVNHKHRRIIASFREEHRNARTTHRSLKKKDSSKNLSIIKITAHANSRKDEPSRAARAPTATTGSTKSTLSKLADSCSRPAAAPPPAPPAQPNQANFFLLLQFFHRHFQDPKI